MFFISLCLGRELSGTHMKLLGTASSAAPLQGRLFHWRAVLYSACILDTHRIARQLITTAAITVETAEGWSALRAEDYIYIMLFFFFFFLCRVAYTV